VTTHILSRNRTEQLRYSVMMNANISPKGVNIAHSARMNNTYQN